MTESRETFTLHKCGETLVVTWAGKIVESDFIVCPSTGREERVLGVTTYDPHIVIRAIDAYLNVEHRQEHDHAFLPHDLVELP